MSYEKNKEHIKKWRREHRAQYREIDRIYKLTNYVPVLLYKFETESRRLRNIRI
jgi:hypothetical protein